MAVILLQRALGVKDDGVAGPVTMKAVAEVKSVSTLTILFLAARLRFMTGLENWPHHGKGWARRIATNLEEAVK
jgi:lysozyme family protein